MALTKAVILAGGKGTRLQGINDEIPKPMMPIAHKPLLQHLIEWCKTEGIAEVYITVNHLKHSIIEHFGDGSSFGLRIFYVEEEKPLGTVGGVKALESQLNEDFLVLYGDVMLNLDLKRLYNFHQLKKGIATLVVHPNDHPHDSDLLEADENGLVTKFLPKPHIQNTWHSNLVNAATYIFSPQIFQFLEKDVKADFGKDIFPKIVKHSNIYAYNTPEYLKDMGTPDRLEKVEGDFLSGKIAARNLKNKQKAIFLDRDGVINYDTDLIKHPDEFTFYPFAAEAIKKINRSGFLAIVVTNQSVIARGLTDLHGLNTIHQKMETELGNKGAFVDAIYFCPHHPHGGFAGEVAEFKTNCTCRKPKPGMLLAAAERFNIDLKQSWMIGDSERDVLAAKAAGVKMVGVKTGHGIKKSIALPDYFMSDLADAVNFIFDEKLDAQVAQLVTLMPEKVEHNFVVSIGGNSRSGKSTLAVKLCDTLNKSGIKATIIHLDDWILPKNDRPGELGVFQNFDTKKLESEVESIISGNKVNVGGYARHSKRERQQATYHIREAQIIIIEGVIALSTARLRNLANLKVFKKIDRQLLFQRFATFYMWKEFESDEINRLFEIREINEYNIIDADFTHADLVME